MYALTAHFGQWLEVVRRGRNVRRWEAAASLIYGQVKKCSRRRKLMQVTHVMRLGTEAALQAAFREVGVDAHEEGHRTLAATERDGWKERPPPASRIGKRSKCKRQAVRG